MNPYMYYPQNTYPLYQQTSALTQQQSAPQVGSFVRVQSEQQAHNYPVSYGASVTFIDENNPYCYVKTMGASQLDPPRFEKYRLVKEEESVSDASAEKASNDTTYATKADCDALSALYAHLKDEVEKLRQKIESEVTKNEQSDSEHCAKLTTD